MGIEDRDPLQEKSSSENPRERFYNEVCDLANNSVLDGKRNDLLDALIKQKGTKGLNESEKKFTYEVIVLAAKLGLSEKQRNDVLDSIIEPYESDQK